jgi:uncharacterized membrane protein
MKIDRKQVQGWFLTGLVVVVPFIVTAYVVWIAFGILDGWIRRFGITIPGVGAVTFLALTVLVGILVRLYTGKRLHNFAEYVIVKLPAVSMVYTTAKEVCQTLFNRDKNAFQYVALVEFGGQKTLGFVTGEAPEAADDLMRGGPPEYVIGAVDPSEKILNVYVMQAFSPAAGFVLLIPASKVQRVEMSVEDGLKFVLTGGMVKGETVVAGRDAAIVS